MKFSERIISIISAAAIICMLSVPAMAGKKAQTGDRDGTPNRDRLKDGSCQDLIQSNNDLLILAGKRAKTGDRDGTPDRDRRRDGSCRS